MNKLIDDDYDDGMFYPVKIEYIILHKVKTLLVREIINLVLKKKLTKEQHNFIQIFLNDSPGYTNYDIKSYFYIYARVGILFNYYRGSQHTFRKHISLYELHDYCYLKLTENQYNSLAQMYILVRDEIMLAEFNSHNSFNGIYNFSEQQYGGNKENKLHDLEIYVKEKCGDLKLFSDEQNPFHIEKTFDEIYNKQDYTPKREIGNLKLCIKEKDDKEFKNYEVQDGALKLINYI